MSSVHPRWKPLLQWLGEKGMDTTNILVEARKSPGAGFGLFALQEIPPSTPLFKVPAKGMMNVRTLVGLYPKARPKLTATQIMSLHLFLHRPISVNHVSEDTVFGPYISVLPPDFDAHPLTWLTKPRDPRVESEDLEIGHDLLEHIPGGVLGSIQNVSARLHEDWKRVSQYLRDNPKLLTTAEGRGRKIHPLDSVQTTLEFLWGWLNVNTRCIYHRLCQTRKDANNITMCPILDFANHSNHLPSSYPQSSHAEIWDQAPTRSIGDDFVLLSPADKTLYRGEEVFLKYGSHSNRTLFSEYGFVNELDMEVLTDGRSDCEADVLWRTQRFFAKRGNIGKWMEELLRVSGYWGEWTIHSAPTPAHPSFRLISALRLYHSVPFDRNLPPHDDHEIVRTWRDTILGKQNMVSPANEAAWRETLNKLCLGIDNETGVNLDNLNKVGREWPVDSWVHYMRRCLVILWREQQHAAWCVHESIDNGVEF